MPEIQQERKVFSLLEVMQSIQRTLSERYSSVFWVKAEMNKLNHYPHSGHCYPDLVEKKEGKVIAQLRATLWKDDYHRINHAFLKVVKAPLKDGITMLFCARIMFDPVHGLSLRIIDIDPVFSLGELEREKQETIDRLKTENIFNQNKLQKLALLPQRIAIISVETSKGYADFNNVINNNGRGYCFFHMLFPSLLQGERAVESMLYQLKRIKRVISHFDVIAIIRGGGAEVGLSCFNNYVLAKEIATFPIPVITGIGHATNETVAEMISYKNAITPTDLANFLLERFHHFADPLASYQEKLIRRTRVLVQDEKEKMKNSVRYFRSITDNVLMKNNHEMQRALSELIHSTRFAIQNRKNLQRTLLYDLRREASAFGHRQQAQLDQLLISLKKDVTSSIKRNEQNVASVEKSVNNMSPENVLKRGYSITIFNEHSIKDATDVEVNKVIKTILAKGSIISEVKSTNEKH